MEALERRGKLMAIAAVLFIVFWSQCRSVEAQRNNTKMSYVCPPDFIRLGHSCYYISETEASWNDALVKCRDRESNLTVPARWEDRNLRRYLTQSDIKKASRWIGGIYDASAKMWRWGEDLKRKMHYQSFSKMKKMTPEELKYHCIAMIPELLYRWSPRNCFEPRRFICQTKLRKEPKAIVKDLRKRWQRMGKINEITAPSVSREINDPMMVNDITANPVPHPKSFDLRPNKGRGPKRHGPRQNGIRNPKAYDLRPNDLKKRSRPAIRSRRLKRPFPGYTWNRRDPEGSYMRNAELLRSGRTGLRPQQINAHLARLLHLRDRQVARQHARAAAAAGDARDTGDTGDWLQHEPRRPRPAAPPLARAHARTYTVDNNISALHPKTIVEEFDMFPQPPPQALPKHTRG